MLLTCLGAGKEEVRLLLLLLLQVTSFSYDGVCVSIREGALGDGLGAKVWAVCHIMCR